MRKSQALEVERFNLITGGHIYFQILIAACELDLFTFLSSKPNRTLQDIQRYLKIPTVSVRTLLLGCCALNLVIKDNTTGKYRNHWLSERFLVRNKPHSIIPMLDFRHHIVYPAMFHLTESLVKGKPVGLNVFSGSGSTMYERLQKHPKLELIFHNCMSTQSKGVNDALAKIKELKKVKHLVDAGGADGTNAMLLHKLFPHMKITIFDLPTVCKIAKRNIAIHRLSHTIFVSPGNILRDQFPKGCDAILFCHVLPSYSPEKIQSVLKKCYDCLPKGGIVVLYQAMSFDDETGPLQPAAVSAYFVALVSGEGMIYPAKDFEEWLSSAGFSKVKRYVPLPKPGHGALVGIK